MPMKATSCYVAGTDKFVQKAKMAMKYTWIHLIWRW